MLLRTSGFCRFVVNKGWTFENDRLATLSYRPDAFILQNNEYTNLQNLHLAGSWLHLILPPILLGWFPAMISLNTNVEYSVEIEVDIPHDFIKSVDPPMLIGMIEDLVSKGLSIERSHVKVRKIVEKTPVNSGDITGEA